MKKLVTEQFRNEIQKYVPNCKLEAHWQLLRTAIFSPYVCKLTGAIRFGAEEIARAYKSEATSNFKAGNKLKEFLDILPEGLAELVLVNGNEWAKGQYKSLESEIVNGKVKFVKVGDGLQRRVLFSWPDYIKELIEDELNDLSDINDKVYFINGNKRNVKHERKEVQTLVVESLSAVELLESPAASYMAGYLNNLPVNSFTQLLDNKELALAEINNIQSEVVKVQQLKILNAVLESPKPIYRPSKNLRTDRLFGTGANITNLKKEVRQALTKDWVEFDLQSSQLAIVSKLWNIPALKSFLESGVSIWSELLSYYGLNKASKEVKSEVKKALKERIYGIVYGESKDRIANGKIVNDKVEDEGLNIALSRFGISKGGVKFLAHPLIKEILKARQTYMKYLLIAGVITDAYGKHHLVNKTNVLSKMSRVAQSYEQILIYGVFELTNDNNDDWSIQLSQHDGVSVKFRHSHTKQYWIAKICQYVNDRCKSYDIPSCLVYEDLTAAYSDSDEVSSEPEVKAANVVHIEFANLSILVPSVTGSEYLCRFFAYVPLKSDSRGVL